MKKKLILIITVVSVLLAVMIFTSRMQSARFKGSSPAKADVEVPASVLYDRMFRMIGSIRAKATIQKLTGEQVTSLRTYFKDAAGLTDEDNEILERTALDFLVEVRDFDDRAAAVIAQGRRQFTDGEVPDGQVVPPPPEELAELQLSRDDLAMRYRERLNGELGQKKFEQLEKFVIGDFASNFQSVPLSSIPEALKEERK